ncbi:hypothetical protein BJY04DRAFT_63981 [Aspergillus karnatakaensis]|uniref:PA and RING finger domain protein n=1 Tax=Aspergillus karnatakaensis TaxID=1810916 RepID=UPI003CCDE100
MRPPRLVLFTFCLIFCPIFITFFSVLTSSPRVSTPSSLAGHATGLHALFSFNLPSSLFPPSAIISLTDENSTFFLARPAAFGPLLPEKGLSGKLWVGTGFGESSPGAGSELGCSDIPGWEEGDGPTESRARKPGSNDKGAGTTQDQRHGDLLPGPSVQDNERTGTQASTNDGTDDHLHHPLPDSIVVDTSAGEKSLDSQTRKGAHADIQYLQESAEISGQVVLLSRGGCGFLEKVKWAQRRGALALIVGDDTRGGNLVTMFARGDTSNVTIPSLFTSYTTAHLLSSLIPPQEREEAVTDGSKTAADSETEVKVAAPATASPSSTQEAISESATETKSGFFGKLASSLGLGQGEDKAKSLEDNRRPPSSGNINWIPMGLWDEPHSDAEGASASGRDSSKSQKTTKASAGAADGDEFVIGVQDWRDPDLMAPKSSSAAVAPGASTSDTKQRADQSTQSTSTLKGGSITPGSGEYHAVEKSSISDKPSSKLDSRQIKSTDRTPQPRAGWFSRHLFSSKSKRHEPASGSKPRVIRDPVQKQDVKTKEHEGLWVTLTPTSMSTSPFFDTLLVLVVSPLLTLSVVYILLLIRSRVRRRRWRAPKNLVERLPVRTYHTISTSSSSSSSLRSSSPGPVSQTSPLLGVKATKRALSQSGKSGAVDSRKEKSSTSTTWRRKYTGRQVECVVCLEEYVDGQSRVMSLPCGHEFHAECITPWLTTRRRTCPICKGDVVRSMNQNHPSANRAENDIETRGTSAPVPITGASDGEMSDLERHISADTGLERHTSSTPPSWRNFAALSLSALSGDTIWHQSRADNES